MVTLYNEVDQTQTKKIQTLQNWSLRIAHKLSNRMNVDKLHTTHKLLHAENKRILHLLIYMHSISESSDLIDTRPLATRQHATKIFKSIFPNTTWFKKTFLYQGIKRWNSLPHELRSITDPDTFKSRIKRRLLDEAIALYG